MSRAPKSQTKDTNKQTKKNVMEIFCLSCKKKKKSKNIKGKFTKNN